MSPKQSRKPKKVGWILAGNADLASARLQGYVIAEALAMDREYSSRIMLAPKVRLKKKINPIKMAGLIARLFIDRIDIAIFQKTNTKNFITVMKYIKKYGKKVIYVECDAQDDLSAALIADVVIVPSSKMKEYIAEKVDITPFVIEDPYEFEIFEPDLNLTEKFDRNRGVWFGVRENFPLFCRFMDNLKNYGNMPEIKTISNHENSDILWQRSLFPDILKNYHYGVIPVGDDEKSNMKSSNRAVLLMGTGIPVIAQENAAHADLIVNGINGYLFTDAKGFYEALKELERPERRRQIIRNGMDTVRKKHSIEAILPKWKDAIASCET